MRWLLAAIAALFATAALAQAVPPSGPDGIACAYNSALPTLSSGQSGWVQCDANGRVIFAAGSTFTGNITQFGGNNVTTGTGASGVGIPRVTVANDSIVGLAAGTNTIGAVTTPTCTGYNLISAATTNSTSVSSAARRLCWLSAINTTATIGYVRIYDASAAPTCSSATGFLFSFPVPANAAGAGFSIPMPQGVTLANGLAFCITGGGTSTDNTSAVANIFINLAYAAS